MISYSGKKLQRCHCQKKLPSLLSSQQHFAGIFASEPMTLPEIHHVSFLVEHAQTFFAGESRVPCVSVKHAYLGKNVRALVLLTFIDNVKKRRNLKICSLEVTKFGNILVSITLQSLKAWKLSLTEDFSDQKTKFHMTAILLKIQKTV